jgi:hypothetical protein
VPSTLKIGAAFSATRSVGCRRALDKRASAAEASGECLIDPRAEDELRAVRSLLHHLTQPVNLGQQAPFARTESNLGDWSQRTGFREQRPPQRLEATLRFRRHEHRIRQQIRYPLLEG